MLILATAALHTCGTAPVQVSDPAAGGSSPDDSRCRFILNPLGEAFKLFIISRKVSASIMFEARCCHDASRCSANLSSHRSLLHRKAGHDQTANYCQSSKVLCTDRNGGLLDWRTNRPAIGSVSCTQHAANPSCATTQTPDTAFSCPELQLSTSRKLCDGCLLPKRALTCYFVRFCQIQATQLVCQSGSIGDQSHSDPCTKPWNFDPPVISLLPWNFDNI